MSSGRAGEHDMNVDEPRSSTSSSPPQHRPSPIVIDTDGTTSVPASPPRSASHPSSEPADEAHSEAKRDADTAGKEKKVKATTSVSAAGKPASTAPGAKPKSTKSAAASASHPRSPSPSPPPAPPKPQLQTIRLDLQLGGPEAYEVDIAALSKATGQRPPTPVGPSKRDTSDDSHSEGDDEGDGKKEKKKRRKKKSAATEYYDTADPFIDDSELAQDERTFFAQTKQKGFYVSSGQVALLNKAPVKKPKSKKVNIMAPSASVTAALSKGPLPPSLAASLSLPDLAGPSTSKPPSAVVKKVKIENGSSKDEPIAIYSDMDEDTTAGMKRKLEEHKVGVLETVQGGSKKRRKTVDVQDFHPELQAMIEHLKQAIARENWEVKGRFPPNLKPLLGQVALKAIILGEYDDNFFTLMPQLFPYNKFTMSKLIKRTIWKEHTTLLMERQNTLLDELKVLADEGFPKAREEYEKAVQQWERRQERAKAEADSGGGGGGLGSVAHSVEGTPATSDTQPTPKMSLANLTHRTSIDETGNETGMEQEHDGEHEDGAGANGVTANGGGRANRDAHPPAKKYRLTDTMKAIIWQLVCLSNECCRIENEKNQLESSNQVVSDQGVRKVLYQKIVNAFPEGWLSSGQISREVSVMKKKYEKEVMENEG